MTGWQLRVVDWHEEQGETRDRRDMLPKVGSELAEDGSTEVGESVFLRHLGDYACTLLFDARRNAKNFDPLRKAT